MQWQAASSLDYFALLVAEDERIPLTEAAAALAQADHPDLPLQTVLDRIDALGARLLARVPADAGPLQKVQLLHNYFFRELGFGCNVNDYYTPANSYLHDVLRTRRGIPISLAVLYLDWANRLGLRATGVSFPGHFLVRLQLPVGDALIDPLNGHSMSRDELEERLEPYVRGHLGAGTAHSLAAFLGEATPREILARMLRNLEAIHVAARDWRRLVPVLDRLVVLEPGVWTHHRDRGLAWMRLGENQRAAIDLAVYVRQAPQAPDRDEIAVHLARLASASGPPH